MIYEPMSQHYLSDDDTDCQEDTASSNGYDYQNNNDSLNAALAYAENGWEIILLKAGTRLPELSRNSGNGKNWSKTKDPNYIKRLFDEFPDDNLAIATGAESGIFVIDIDTLEKHGVDGFASLDLLEQQYGALPETLTAESPSGSRHSYFNYPDKITNSTSDLAPGIDVRGEGGMIIAPPSVITTKGTYRWTNQAPIVDAPPWLLELLTPTKQRQSSAFHNNNNSVSAEKIFAALSVVSANCRHHLWLAILCGIYKECGTNGFVIGDAWSATASDKYKPKDFKSTWEGIVKARGYGWTIGTLFWKANQVSPGWWKERQEESETLKSTPADEGVSLADFRAYMPTHSYIYMPTRDMWPGSSVNSRVPPVQMINADGTPKLDKRGQQETVSPTSYLDKERPVEQMTWAPGLPMLIPDRIISEGGWIDRQGVNVFNLYRPPTIEPGGSKKAGPWIRLVIKVFGKNDARHIIAWFASRVQHPEDKINHAIVLGSEMQGVGKDTIIEPVKRAVGPWNCKEVSPKSVTGRFNPFLKSVLLRISEARDLGDVSRYDFYEAMKAYTASPPDVLTCDEKNLREHSILNCVGIIYTTNHKQGGMFLPAEDRRHFVAWSERKPTDFPGGYWDKFWEWLEGGGDRHVAAYLASLDISKTFDPKAPPPKTAAFWDIVDSNRAPEISELADVLDEMGNPKATTIDLIKGNCGFDSDFKQWLNDRKNRRSIPHRMEQCGYVVLRNDGDKHDGQWKIHGKRCTVYVLAALSNRERHKAVTELQGNKKTFPGHF